MEVYPIRYRGGQFTKLAKCLVDALQSFVLDRSFDSVGDQYDPAFRIYLFDHVAKLKGAEVCTTVGSQDKARLVRQLGADHPILYKQTDFVQAALDWTGGEGVDVAFDTIGGEIFSKSFPAVRVYGDVVTILEPDAATNWKAARSRNLRISLELMLTPLLQGLVAAQQHQAEILKQCAQWIDEGKLKIHLSETYPLQEAAAAHKAIETGSTTGKISLIME